MVSSNLSFTMNRNALFIVYDDDENRPLATAFCFIKPEWVVTAKHAVLEMGVPRQRLSLIPTYGDSLRASVHFVHSAHDLAVLRIEGRSPCEVPLFPAYAGYTGSRGLIGCGFAPSRPTNEGFSYTIVANPIDAYEREERMRDTGTEALVVFDAPWMEGGYSGGPVFSWSGGVIGVLIELIRSPGSGVRGRATSILHLLRFLNFPTA